MRLDKYLVAHKFVDTREKAQVIIKNGDVLVNEKVILKPSFEILEQEIKIDEKLLKYVSRGGFKLEKALEYFNISLENKIVLDIGASTGGFSDCALQNRALKVIALENGNNQLHESLRANTAVISLENTNIMDYTDFNVDFITIDVSFVSLEKILLHIFRFYQKEMVVLIKPQFECGKENLNKNNVCLDKKIHLKIISKYKDLFKQFGFQTSEVIESPIKGKKSLNTEYLIYCWR